MNGAEEIATIATTTTATTYDPSLLSIFIQASLAVKLIVILLIVCSFWSWTIIFAKLTHLKRLKAAADKFEESFWNCGSLDAFFENVSSKGGDDPFVMVFIAGMQEWRRAKSKVKSVIGGISLNERIAKIMGVVIGREMEYLERHVGFLASVGSTAPFVGVFGTVIGIVNTFESIGATQNTSLAAVAPGIAEALYATALGLFVTVPTVIAYNKISSEIGKYQNRLESFIAEFSSIVARQIEESEA
ncbi:MAG: protein TolQ [Holosporaceae bacterium]|jgi:biopolymer transport protein TolQ|nr:protein TolQ [Holosporaceae bacterium]